VLGTHQDVSLLGLWKHAGPAQFVMYCHNRYGIRSGGGTSTKILVTTMGLWIFKMIALQPRRGSFGYEWATSAFRGPLDATGRVRSLVKRHIHPQNVYDNLSKDPFFRALFKKADSAQEAITVASAFGVNLSIRDVSTYRKELRAMIGKQSFHLDVPRSTNSSCSFGGDVGDVSGAGTAGESVCSDYGGACSDF